MSLRQKLQKQIDHAQQMGWLIYFRDASIKYRIPIAILLAIASRESGIGTDQPFKNSTVATSRGIMQVDQRFHDVKRDTTFNEHHQNILTAASILAQYRERFPDNKSAWIAAYNTGPSDVSNALRRGEDPDTETSGGNYASDIIKRASTIKNILLSRYAKSGLYILTPLLLVVLPLLYFQKKS